MDILFSPTTWMVIIFLMGYLLITLEHQTKVNKAAIALLTGILCWVLQFSRIPHESLLPVFCTHLASTMQVILFLLGALTIVEIISSHGAFSLLARVIRIHSKKKLLWFIGFLTFFLSALLDNLTTTIVIISLLKKLLPKGEDRMLLGSAVVVAANAGGAWTPIGDVTTTMLWIGGQLTTPTIIEMLFLPSIACVVASLFCMSFFLKGRFTFPEDNATEMAPLGRFVFFLGIGCLAGVPLFKLLTGLPPFMAILFGLGIMWLITDIAHREVEERYHLRVPQVMSKVDLTTPFFFLGILLAVDALAEAGLLEKLAFFLEQTIGEPHWLAILIGLASSIVDNVPLVAATMNMYPLSSFPIDNSFWVMLAFCAGTGGSILLIGSAAGVALMGLEQVDFFWYLRRVAFSAIIGFFAGVGTYLLLMA